jgi:chitin-binding protein
VKKNRVRLCFTQHRLRKISILFWLLAVIAGVVFVPAQKAAAHGAVGFPISRQYECRLEEGYWGDPSQVPKPDCRQAYIEGGGPGYGHWPFQQWNEVSANPVGWGNNQAELEKAVPNGLLCAGGDARKAGLDKAPATLWRKTTVHPVDGKIDVVWENTQPHNPAIMRIYISKTSYDGSRPLRWDDLEKIYQEPAPQPTPANGGGHIPNDVVSFYTLHVPIPAGRTGDAVLYSYWQREDGGNEGFFNCSDIRIDSDEGIPGFPWLEKGPYLPQGFTPQVGDQVRFRVMGGSARGLEIVDVYLPITQQNVSQGVWTKELAEKLNSQHAQYVQIGARSGNDIRYDGANVAANRVWLKSGYSYAMGIESGNPPEPGHPVAHISGPNTVEELSTVTYSGQQSTGDELKYLWNTAQISPGSGREVTFTGTAPAATSPFPVEVSLTVTDSHGKSDKAEETVTVMPKGTAPEYPKWNRDDVKSYAAGTKVTGLDGKVWECKEFPYSAWCAQTVPDNVTDENWAYAAGSSAAAGQPEEHRAWKPASGK